MKWRATFIVVRLDPFTGQRSPTSLKTTQEIDEDDYDKAVVHAHSMVGLRTDHDIIIGPLIFIKFVNDLTEAEKEPSE